VEHISVVIDSRLNNTVVPDSRKMRRDVQIARTREKGNVHRVLVGKPELGRPSPREESTK
jgi:hypothetical protein